MVTLEPLVERLRVLKVELRELQGHLDNLRALRDVAKRINLQRLHHRLIRLCHPDRGGSTELSQDVNRLFSALLGEILN